MTAKKKSEQPSSSSKQNASGRKSRRASGALRKSNVDRGAHLIKMHQPDDLLDPMLLCPDREYYNLDEYPRHQPGSTAWNAAYLLLANALRKGVFITQHGCIIPHYRWCTKGDGVGAGQKGYQLVGTVVYGFAPSGQPPDEVTLPPGWSASLSGTNGTAEDNRKVRLFNAMDWDSTLEASHLCHNHQCMNPLHIVYEPSWRNRKRNYCGSKGQCDCGQQPQCLQPYTPSERPWAEFQHQNVDRSSIEQLLFQPLRARGLLFSFERGSLLQARDEKAAKRNERVANNKKQRDAEAKSQAFGAAKKAARRISNALADKECARAALTSPKHHKMIASAAEHAMLKHLNPDEYMDSSCGDDNDFQ